MAKVMSDEDHAKLVALLEAMIPKIADLEYELTAYQIAKDNLELRLYGNPSFEIAGAPELPAQVY